MPPELVYIVYITLFREAAKMLSAEELQDVLPMSFPRTHVLHSTLFPGIAKYPVDDWIAEGQPCITEEVWTKLCLRIASKDRQNLENIFSAAERF